MNETLTDTLTPTAVQLTPGAIAEARRLQQSQPAHAGKPLRIGVKGGGCAGFTYILEFDEKREGDSVMEIDGLTVVVDFAHELYLSGTVVDFENGLNNRGFTFSNPNATKTCGCGSSFG